MFPTSNKNGHEPKKKKNEIKSQISWYEKD